MIDFKLQERLPRFLSLEELKKHVADLQEPESGLPLQLFRTPRLSCQRVPKQCWDYM